MRFEFTTQPASRAARAALRQPQRGREREKSLRKARRASSSALGGAALSDDTAGSALGDPEPLGEHHDGSPATVRG